MKISNNDINCDWLRIVYTPKYEFDLKKLKQWNFNHNKLNISNLKCGVSNYQNHLTTVLNESDVHIFFTPNKENGLVFDFSGNSIPIFEPFIQIQHFLNKFFTISKTDNFKISRLDVCINFPPIELGNLKPLCARMRNYRKYTQDNVITGYSIGARGGSALHCRIYHKFMQNRQELLKALNKYGTSNFTRLEYEIGKDHLRKLGIENFTQLLTEYSHNKLTRIFRYCVNNKSFLLNDEPIIDKFTLETKFEQKPIIPKRSPIEQTMKQGIGCILSCYKILNKIEITVDKDFLYPIIKNNDKTLFDALTAIECYFDPNTPKEVIK